MKLKFSWVIIVGFLHTHPVIDEHIDENSWIPSWNRTIGPAKGTIGPAKGTINHLVLGEHVGEEGSSSKF